MIHLSRTLYVEEVVFGEAAGKFGLSPEQFLYRFSSFIGPIQMTKSRDESGVRPIMGIGDANCFVGPFCGGLMLFQEQIGERSIHKKCPPVGIMWAQANGFLEMGN